MAAKEHKPEERRREPRTEVSFPVTYKLLDEQGRPQESISGSAVNVSGGGLRFQTSRQLEPGRVVSAEFQFRPGAAAVMAVGKVAWCHPADGGSFCVGMEFWWLGWRDETAERSLAQYVESKLRPKGE